MRSNDTNVRRVYETKFQTEFKSAPTRVPFPCSILYCDREGLSMLDAIENDQYFKFSYSSN